MFLTVFVEESVMTKFIIVEIGFEVLGDEIEHCIGAS